MNHSPKTNYDPQVDDYVIWNRPNGDIEEGWVYFKGDPVDNEKLKSDLLKNEADEFWANCESKAAELEVTVDYYLEEFYI